MATPLTFWNSPVRYLRWAFHAKPALAWSIVIGSIGPTFPLWVPRLRKWAGDEDPPAPPLSYPVPKGPRQRPAGFEDP